MKDVLTQNKIPEKYNYHNPYITNKYSHTVAALIAY